jgi:hypothetical protein
VHLIKIYQNRQIVKAIYVYIQIKEFSLLWWWLAICLSSSWIGTFHYTQAVLTWGIFCAFCFGTLSFCCMRATAIRVEFFLCLADETDFSLNRFFLYTNTQKGQLLNFHIHCRIFVITYFFFQTYFPGVQCSDYITNLDHLCVCFCLAYTIKVNSKIDILLFPL